MKKSDEFLKLVLSLTDQEKQIINSFEKRFKTNIKHQKIINKIIKESKLLRKRKSNKKKVRKHIREFTDDILSKFTPLIDKDITFNLQLNKFVHKETEIREETETFFAYDFQEIKKTIQQNGMAKTNAKKQLEKILEHLNEEIKEEYKEIDINKYLTATLDNFKIFINEQKQLINQEIKLLKNYEFEDPFITEEIAKKLIETENNLKTIAIKLRDVMIREKEEFFEPFNKFLKQKTFLDRQIYKLSKQDKITKKQLLADIRMFSKPSEVHFYQNQIMYHHFEKLDNGAKKLLFRISNSATEMSAKERIELGVVSQIATTDALTKVGNRGYFDRFLDHEIKRSKRYNLKFCLIIMDIDHFKIFNDTYGHPVGDIVLQNVVKYIKNKIRESDNIFRYGGEEFTIVLPRTELNGAYIIAEKIRKEVLNKSQILMKKENETTKINKKINQITISMGISSYPIHGKRSNDLIKLADEALYTAKKNGRNQVQIYHKK